MSESRHPTRLAVFADGTVYYPRELTEVDGKLYITDEDGTSRILNDYKITTIKDGDGNSIGSVDPLTQKDLTLPNASESARGMVKLGASTPKAATTSGSKGTSTAVSHEDHTHPAQTDITGNAGTADAFSSVQEVELTGDVTGSASSTGGWSIATTLKSSGVTAGSYGPNADATPDHEESFVVPQITVDAKGRVTNVVSRKVTLPAQSDTYVHPTNGANTTVGPTADATPAHGESFVVPQITVNNLGHVTSATARTIKLPAGYTHPDSGVTAGKYGPSANATPDYGETFTVPEVTVDEQGHVTGATARTVKIPTKPDLELEDVTTAGSYGPTADVSDYEFKVPYVEVDAKGRVIAASDKTVTIPSKKVLSATINPATHYVSGTESPYKYTVAISGILATDNPIVDLVLSDDYSTAQEQLSEFGKIYSIETADGSVTISAVDELNADLPLTLNFVCIISPKSIENYTVTVPTTDWTGTEAPYSKTIAVSGIRESDTPIVDLVLPDDYSAAQDQLIEFNKVYKVNVVDNSITLYATEVPTAEVVMKMMCIR